MACRETRPSRQTKRRTSRSKRFSASVSSVEKKRARRGSTSLAARGTGFPLVGGSGRVFPFAIAESLSSVAHTPSGPHSQQTIPRAPSVKDGLEFGSSSNRDFTASSVV